MIVVASSSLITCASYCTAALTGFFLIMGVNVLLDNIIIIFLSNCFAVKSSISNTHVLYYVCILPFSLTACVSQFRNGLYVKNIKNIYTHSVHTYLYTHVHFHSLNILCIIVIKLLGWDIDVHLSTRVGKTIGELKRSAKQLTFPCDNKLELERI